MPTASKVTSRGKVNFPENGRECVHPEQGNGMKTFKHPDGSVIMLPTLPVTVLAGILQGRSTRNVTLEDMERGIAEGAVERMDRLKRRVR